jgi:hypothetical protein
VRNWCGAWLEADTVSTPVPASQDAQIARPSSGAAVWRGVVNVASTTVCALSKTPSGMPGPISRLTATLSGHAW